MKKKTWATEAGIIMALFGGLEVAQNLLTEYPIIPEPWGGAILIVIGAAVAITRTIAKAKAINLDEPKA
jgi:hypothetical protein